MIDTINNAGMLVTKNDGSKFKVSVSGEERNKIIL